VHDKSASYSQAHNTGNSWLRLKMTSEDVKKNCEDLKVLGKGDFKALLRWRSALRQEVSPPTTSNNLSLCLSAAWL
jgi:hypothetical protein